MNKILLTTTASFSKTVETSELKKFLAERGIEVILQENLDPPFSFDEKEVFGLVAGHVPTGKMLHVGPKEAAKFPNIKLVMPFGVGIDHIDREGLEKAGVMMKILPPLSKRTVAELAIAFLFALARQIGPLNQAMKGGVWQRVNGSEVFGKCLGIIGIGNIGKETAKIARGLGMKVIANDLVYDEQFIKEHGIEKADLNDVLAKSDFLTLHVPLTELTSNLLNKSVFDKMKPGIFIINTSRGAVIDEASLFEALESGRVAGAALDVFSEEPPFTNEIAARLVAHPNVLATPHVGAFTPQTRYAIAKKVCEDMAEALTFS